MINYNCKFIELFQNGVGEAERRVQQLRTGIVMKKGIVIGLTIQRLILSKFGNFK